MYIITCLAIVEPYLSKEKSQSLGCSWVNFIHPSISLRLSGVGSWGQYLKQGGPDFPLLNHMGQYLWGNPEAFPGYRNSSYSLSANLTLHYNRLVHHLHHCKWQTNPPINLLFHFSIICELVPQTLKFLRLRQDLVPNPKKGTLPISSSSGRWFDDADFHLGHFTLQQK